MSFTIEEAQQALEICRLSRKKIETAPLVLSSETPSGLLASGMPS
jgi:hypothetical protein